MFAKEYKVVALPPRRFSPVPLTFPFSSLRPSPLQVVIALASKSRDHVPYRQTKLTHVLKDSLGGNCTTLMIACVWPHLSHLDQSLSTLKFAARMQTVRNKPTVNESKANNVASVKLLRQIKSLKEELAFHDIISGRSEIIYEEPTDHEMRDIKDKVRKYVEDESENVEVRSLQHFKVVMGIMREMILDRGGGGVRSGGVSNTIVTPRREGRVEREEEVRGGRGEGGVKEETQEGGIFSAVKTEQVMMSPTSDAYLQKKKMKEAREMEEENRARSLPRASPATGKPG